MKRLSFIVIDREHSVSTGAKCKTKLPTGKKVPGDISFEGKTTSLPLLLT